MKLSKEMIDYKVEEILKAQELIKTLGKRVEEVKAELETQYIKPVSESEEVLGNEYKVVKTARDMGKNSVDYSKAAELLKPAELTLVEEKVINVVKLQALIKAKIIDAGIFKTVKKVSWVSATSFSHIENVKTIKVEVKPETLKREEAVKKSLIQKLFNR